MPVPTASIRNFHYKNVEENNIQYHIVKAKSSKCVSFKSCNSSDKSAIDDFIMNELPVDIC